MTEKNTVFYAVMMTRTEITRKGSNVLDECAGFYTKDFVEPVCFGETPAELGLMFESVDKDPNFNDGINGCVISTEDFPLPDKRVGVKGEGGDMLIETDKYRHMTPVEARELYAGIDSAIETFATNLFGDDEE